MGDGVVPAPVLALVVVVVHWQGGAGVLSQPQLLIGVVEPTSEEESLPIPHLIGAVHKLRNRRWGGPFLFVHV